MRDVVNTFELDESELAIPRPVRTAEALDALNALNALNAVVAAEGVTDPHSGRAHPALIEPRQQRMTPARLIASLLLRAGSPDPSSCRSSAPRTRTRWSSLEPGRDRPSSLRGGEASGRDEGPTRGKVALPLGRIFRWEPAGR